MKENNRKNFPSAGKGTGRRLAVLAGAMMLTFASPLSVWADADKGGDTVDTAVTVPAFPGGAEDSQAGQGAASSAGSDSAGGTVQGGVSVIQSGSGTDAGQTADSSQAVSGGQTTGSTAAAGGQTADSSQTTAATQTGESGGTATRIIRTQTAAGTTAGSSGSGTAVDSVSQATSGGDYSLGPGYFGQSGVQIQQSLDPNSATSNAQIYDVTNPVVKVAEKYSYDQMVQDINTLKMKYGNKMQVNTIGTSLDGRAIYDCIIGNVSAPRHILIQGGIHGREYLNPLLLMQQMEMALANYDTGSFNGNSLSSMFSQVAVHFVPMTNPDGITISQFGPDMLRSQTLKDAVSTCYVMDTAAGRTSEDTAGYFSKWKANAEGVDLNLNFDALWQQVSSTEFPSYSGYKGTAPGSEPETQALMNLYNDSRYNWKAVIHYHSMGNVIYWDILGNKVQAESSELANLMSTVTGGYRLLPSEGGGGYKDWIRLSSKPVPSVTLETGKVSCPMPISEYSSIWTDNRLTWAVAMEWVAAR